jgi:hypothetical protein
MGGRRCAIGAMLSVACAVPQMPAPGGTDLPPCADHTPLREVFWGDLHVHSGWSFDAGAYKTVVTTEGALRFAQGETVWLPPLDEYGQGTRPARLERPLDFVAVTEHGEFLGEVLTCTTPGMPGYEAPTCAAYRDDGMNGAFDFGVLLANRDPGRFPDVCGEDGSQCVEAARLRWAQMRQLSQAANDPTAGCRFSAFVAYEYTNTADVSNLHRNVVFRDDTVPALPITHFEAPSPMALWTGLAEACTEAGTGCDVIVLPHNSNLSNGQLFIPEGGTGFSIDEQAERAALRARMEPAVEVFQHKGDSECRNGFSGVATDPDCDFEKLRPPDDDVCAEPGSGGMRLWGCSHPLDFVRNVLKTGLTEEARIALNPYRLGFIASTDTHNGTPGPVSSVDFPGHVGLVDATPEARLGPGNATHDALIYNPGGLAAVWAEENRRDAIFDAIRRRETYATSGPRIRLRMFGGQGFPTDLCADPDRIAVADSMGVPMGGVLNAPISGRPQLFIEVEADDTPLQQIQVVKGWLDADGVAHERVIIVAGNPDNGAAVDLETCQATGPELSHLCTVWTDPDWNQPTRAFYYARVLENPTCRWSTRQCNRLLPGNRPSGCTGATVQPVVQQRAWSSPIWVTPED